MSDNDKPKEPSTTADGEVDPAEELVSHLVGFVTSGIYLYQRARASYKAIRAAKPPSGGKDAKHF